MAGDTGAVFGQDSDTQYLGVADLPGLLWWLDPIDFDLTNEAITTLLAALPSWTPFLDETSQLQRLGAGTGIDNINYPLGTRENPLVVNPDVDPTSLDRNFDAFRFGGYDVYKGDTHFRDEDGNVLAGDANRIPEEIEGYDSHSNFVGSDMPVVHGWWDNLIAGNIPNEPKNPAIFIGQE